MASSEVLTEPDVAIVMVIQWSTDQGEGGELPYFLFSWHSLSPEDRCIGQGFGFGFQQWLDHDSIGTNPSSVPKRRR
jgi:hypothetical protein